RTRTRRRGWRSRRRAARARGRAGRRGVRVGARGESETWAVLPTGAFGRPRCGVEGARGEAARVARAPRYGCDLGRRRLDQALLGIDVGGTKVAFALGDRSGRIAARSRRRTDPSGRAEKDLDRMVDDARALLAQAGLAPG